MTTPTLAARPNPLTALATLTRVETLLLLREPAAVLFTLALPLVLLLLNSSEGNTPNPRFGGAGTTDVLMAGYLVYVMATSAIMGLGETLADYRDRGILRRLRITPLRPWQILTSHALTHLAMSVLGVILLVTVGALAADLQPAGLDRRHGLGHDRLGLLDDRDRLPARRSASDRAHHPGRRGGDLLPGHLRLRCLVPREVLPAVAQRIGDFLPMRYAVRSIRQAWTPGTVDEFGLAILAVTTVVGVAVAVRMFRWEAR